MLIASHHTTLNADEGAPEWVHLVPAGTFSGDDGRGPYVLTDAAAVIRASMAEGASRPIDENHATDHAAKSGGPAPARGWIVAMEARPDGVWGQVEWTAKGRALVEARAYRGISPVFTHTRPAAAGSAVRVVQVLRAALTNVPNLSQLKTLHTQDPDMDLSALRQALSLPETADLAACVTAAAAAHTAMAAHTAQVSETTRLAGELVALQTELGTLRQSVARERATAAVDTAIKAGKPIPAALREHYIARHCADAAAVEMELAALPSLHSGGLGSRNPTPSAEDPTVIALQARKLVDAEEAAGRSLHFAEAVQRVSAGAA